MPRQRGFKWDNREKKQYIDGSEINFGGVGGGSTNLGDTPPLNPVSGDTWFDTSNGAFFVYYSDGTSNQWVGVSGPQGESGGASSGGSSVVGGVPITVSASAPSSASEGDLWFNSSLLETYVYYDTHWVILNPAGGGGSSVTASDTAPSSPSDGDLWFDTTGLTTYVYYNDGGSSQWVSAMPSGVSNSGGGGAGVTTYADITARDAATPSQGDLAFVTSVTALYVYDGSQWDRIWSGADESPIIITEPPTTHTLNSDGTTSTVTMVAEDPEGFDISYGIVYKTTGNTRPVQLSTDTTVNTSGVYTFTPTTNEANDGNFTARLSASDGSRTTTRLIDFKLDFIPQKQNIIGRYEFADTNSYNPAVSTTVLNDLSGNSNNQTISNPGSLSGDGHLTFSTSSTINFGSMSGQKTWAVISRPSTGYNQHVLFDNAASDAVYYSVFHSSQGSDYYGYQTGWAGETVVDTVNGIYPNNNRTTSYNALTLNQSNSIITTGLQMSSSAMYYNAYPTWIATHEVYAFVFWDVVLTLSEIQKVHDYYRNKIGAANMAAWQG